MVRHRLVVGAALALVAGSAVAQDRSPTQRQALSDLAYALGESHALRQACHGEADQFWRSRMERLIEVEAPEQTFTVRLSRQFNAGFAAAQASFPTCDPKVPREAARVAARAARIARALAG